MLAQLGTEPPPEAATLQPSLSHVAHLADWMVVDLGIGRLVDAEQVEPSPAALAEFRVPRAELPRMVDSLRRLFADSAELVVADSRLKEAI